MTDIFFHIGLSRAASTALQRDVFRKVGALGTSSKTDSMLVVRDYFHNHSPDIWKTEKGQKVADSMLKHARNNRILFTDDSLSNSMIFTQPGHDYLKNYPERLAMHLENFKKHAWRDKGRVGVFFLCRNQPEWLASRYSKTMNDAFRLTKYRSHLAFDYQGDFETRIRSILDDQNGYLHRTLCYDELAKRCMEAVGEENVLPLLFENISDPALMQQITDFTGFTELDVNHFKKARLDRYTRTSSSQDKWVIRTNHIRIRSRFDFLNYLVNGTGKRIEPYVRFPVANREIYMSGDLRNEIKTCFETSNRNFEVLTGLCLEGLGYYPEKKELHNDK